MPGSNAASESALPLAVVLYGSHARGDADEHSDRDVFVAVEDAAAHELSQLRSAYAEKYSTTFEGLSLYTRKNVSVMAQRGSLFLWHLKLEGRVVEDPIGFMDSMFCSLAVYSDYDRDIARYKQVLDDVDDSLATAGRSVTECDLHTLFVVARNTAMLLTVRAGKPTFGRRSVYGAATAHYGVLPLSPTAWATLELFHLCYARGVRANLVLPSQSEAKEIANSVRSMLVFLRGNLR